MIPLSNSKFQLDVSGVGGFFGGEEAISAMKTIHVYKNRKLLGWYNSPGSYTVAKKYGQIARSRFWDGLFPGTATEPTSLFDLNGGKGPRYFGAHSGTQIETTGHIGSLFLDMCQKLAPKPLKERDGEDDHDWGERNRSPVCVTIVTLDRAPDETVELVPKRKASSLITALPMLCSAGACVAAGYFHDWFSCFLILLGMFTTGFSCLAIGSGKFQFRHPVPAVSSPPANGFLLSNEGVIVLLGEEGAVNSVTRGRFQLKYSGAPEYRVIGVAAMLLTVQFLLQLILIPQATLFGQILFLLTFAVSWIHNCYFSSIDMVEIQQSILKEVLELKPNFGHRYTVGSWTAMATFVLQAVQPSDAKMARKVLDVLIPNNSEDWKRWKTTVAQKVINCGINVSFDNEINNSGIGGMLQTIFKDAEYASQGYKEISTFQIRIDSKQNRN